MQHWLITKSISTMFSLYCCKIVKKYCSRWFLPFLHNSRPRSWFIFHWKGGPTWFFTLLFFIFPSRSGHSWGPFLWEFWQIYQYWFIFASPHLQSHEGNPWKCNELARRLGGHWEGKEILIKYFWPRLGRWLKSIYE